METSKMRICLEKLVILTCIGMLYTPKVNCSCSIDWSEKSGSCFFVSPTSTKWEKAKIRCASEGAHLVYLGNGRPVNFLNDLSSIFDEAKEYFVGAKKEGSVWKWGDGRDVVLPISAPNNNDIYALRKFDDLLVATGENHESYYICEKADYAFSSEESTSVAFSSTSSSASQSSSSTSLSSLSSTSVAFSSTSSSASQ
ncbi:killer cell lectin-like receptor subfamily B member 1, partial [Nematostella vectensis]|uniref:killer cell lectin-like receptor subfamily B member 1 n=1 Tax=Nematostella vectensis TaxID=45351 RepID=UPI0020773769